MPYFKWSNQNRWWRNLCSNTVYAETSVPNVENTCEICIEPIKISVPETTGTGTGTSPETGTGTVIEPPIVTTGTGETLP